MPAKPNKLSTIATRRGARPFKKSAVTALPHKMGATIVSHRGPGDLLGTRAPNTGSCSGSIEPLPDD